MKLPPLRAWIQTLLDLGFSRQEKFPKPKARKSRRSQIETLEARQLLTGSPLYWVGGTLGTWDTVSTNLKWSPNPGGGSNQAWDSTAKAVFDGAGAAITVASGITADAIQFNTGGFTLSTPSGSGGSITLGATDTISVAIGMTDTISSPLTVGANFAETGGGTLVAGNISGSGSVQINAGNRLTANSIVAGSLVISGTAGSPATVTIAASQNGTAPTTLDWDGPGANNWNWNPTAANWRLDVNGVPTGPDVAWNSGDIAIFGGTGGTISVASGMSAYEVLFLTNGYTLSDGTLVTGNVNVSTGVQATINSPLYGSNGLDLSGGGTLLLSGSNHYSGPTILSRSTLMLGNSSALGQSSYVSSSLELPGVLDLYGQNISGTAAFDLFPGTIINSSSTPAICAAAVNDQLNGSNIVASTLNVAGPGTITLSGVLDGHDSYSLDQYSIVKSGTSTLILTGQETYTGATNINAGTLQLSGGGGLSNTVISVSPRATFAPHAGSGSINAGGNTAGTAGATLTLGPGSTFDMTDGAKGTFNLRQQISFPTANAALTINGATLDFELNGSLADSLAVTKAINVSGVNTINIATLGSPSTGTYTLTLISSAATNGLTLGSGASFVFDNGTNTKILGDNNSYKLVLNTTLTSVTLTVSSYSDPNSSDPVLLAAVRQALAIPTDQPVTTANWQQLTSLSADSNLVHSLAGIGLATSLTSLTLVPSDFHVAGNSGIGASLSQLSNLTSLKSLTLQDCGLSDSTPWTNLPSLANLQTLDLRYNNINTIPPAVANQPKLTSLLLFGNPLAGNGSTTWYASLSGKLLTVDIAPNNPQQVIENINPANPGATYTSFAAAFYNLPLAIYQYLVNTIQYQPYDGAMKGPLAVLETGAGNDWDTNSLLAAVLNQISVNGGSNTSISTSYVSGWIQVPVQQAEQYVGAQDPIAAGTILQNAGQHTSTQNVTVFSDVIRFTHTWLSAVFTTSGTALPPILLDASWKLRDFQSGLPDLLTPGLVPFDQAGYLAAPQKQSAAEYYEGQVRGWLALPANHPNLTVADVAYNGPIHQQVFTAPPAQLPYADLNTSQDTTNAGAVVPNSLKDKVEVKLVFTNGGGTVFDWTGYVPDISLQRLTVNPNINPNLGTALPQLLLDGSPVASYFSTITNAAATQVTLTVNVTSPDPTKSYSPVRSYTRYADRYMAIGLDANQISDQLVVSRRAVVNAQELVQKNNETPNQDAETGGILALAVATYFHDADQGEKSIAGLTGAVQDFTEVASGVATSSSATPTLVASGQVQLPYQPTGMGIDVPENLWAAISINSGDSQGVNRDTLLGLHNSSMEELVWEELTNVPSLSTTASLQLAHQHSIPVVTIAPAASLANIQSALSGISATNGLATAVENYISTYVNQTSSTTDYQAIVPNGTTPVGIDSSNHSTFSVTAINNGWVGVGYILQTAPKGTGAWSDFGFVIQGYGVSNGQVGTLEAPHGGVVPTGVPPTPPAYVTLGANIPSLGDPVNAADGDVWNDATDFSIPNLGAPLGMSRHYHSFNTAGPSQTSLPDRGMGDGWSFTYSDTIAAPIQGVDYPMGGQAPASGSVVWFTDTGIRLLFTPKSGGGYNTPATVYGTLTMPNSSTYVWTDKTGAVVTFSNSGSGTTYYVTQIQDRYGNGVHIVRVTTTGSTFGRITSVYDLVTNSRVLNFTYTGNHITQISDNTVPSTPRSWNYYYDSTTATGRLTSVQAPAVPVLNPATNTTTSVAPTTTYAYVDATANPTAALHDLLQTVIDPKNNTTQFAYYANRRGFQVTDAAGDVQSFSFNLFRNRTALTDERGQTTYFDYDTSGNVLQQLNPDRTTQTYTYNAGDQKLTDTDAYGQTEWFQYDTNGNVTQFTDRLNTTGLGDSTRTTTSTYNSFGEPLLVTRGSDGKETKYNYNPTNGDLTNVADDFNDSSVNGGAGNVTSYYYPGMLTIQGTDRGQPTAKTSPNGIGVSSGTTWYLYNSDGQVTTQYSEVSGSSFDPPPLIPIFGPPSGANAYASKGWNYDNRGNLTDSTDGNGFDSSGNPLNNGNTATYTSYDPLGRLQSETQPAPGAGSPLLAAVTNFGYDANGNLLSTNLATVSAPTTPLRTKSTAYDKMNRVVKSVNPDGTYSSVEYDPAGNLVYSTDAMGRVTQFVYDSRNRAVATIRPDGTVVRTAFDGGGRVVAATDADGNTTRYFYDQLGRKTEEIAPYMSLTQAQTIDDSSANTSIFSTSGAGWTQTSGAGGFGGEYKSTMSTASGTSATWTFTGLPVNPGYYQEAFYQVFVTWAPSSGNTTSAFFATPDASDANKGATVNETLAPAASPLFADGAWQQLPVLLRCHDGTLTITLKNNGAAGTALVADAVRLVQVTPTITTYDDVSDKTYSTVAGYTHDPNHTTETDTDKLGRVTQVIQPAPSVGAARPTTAYKYDSNGNLIQVTDPRQHNTLYFYDEMNRKIAQVEQNPANLDGGYSVSTINTVNDLTTQYFYDKNSNLVDVVNAADPNQYLAGTTTLDRSAYNDNGNAVYYTTQYVYDNLNRKTQETDPQPASGAAQPVTVWAYDQNGNLQSVQDPNGNLTQYAYNLDNERIQVTDALGALAAGGSGLGDPLHTVTTMYDAVGNVLSVTTPAPQAAAPSPQPPVPSPQTWFQYDAMNRKIAEIAPLPAAVGAGVLVGAGLSTVPTTTWSYDQNGNVTSTTDPLGNTTSTQYNGWNQPIAVTDALGYKAGDPQHTVTTAYDALGRAVAMTDQLGRTTQFVYDNLGRKVQEIAPVPVAGASSPVTYFGYDLNGNLRYTTDPRGAQAAGGAGQGDHNYTTWHFDDGLNREIAMIDPQSSYVTWTGTNVTDTTSFTAGPNLQPDKSRLTFYDKLGNVTSVSQSVTGPIPNSTTPTASTVTRTTTFAYDNLSRKVKETDPAPAPGVASPVTTWSYDSNGNILSTTDPLGHTSYTVYDALNRATASVSALGVDPRVNPTSTVGKTTTAFDAAGNVSTVTDPDGNTTSSLHDRLNREVQTIDPLWNSTALLLDADGNVVQKTDRDGRVTTYAYDPLNRRVQENWLDGSTTGSNIFHTIQTYLDAAGQVVGVTETEKNTSLHVAVPSNAAIYQYSYDQDGRLTTSRMAPGELPQTPPTVVTGQVNSNGTIDWNGTGTLKPYNGYSVPLTAGDVVLITVSSTAFDAVAFAQRPGGTTSTWLIDDNSGGAHNAVLRFVVPQGQTGTWVIGVTSASATASGAYTLSFLDNPNPFVTNALVTLSYSYDAAGNRLSVTDSSGGQSAYQYDSLDRLKQAKQYLGVTVSSAGSVNERADMTYFDDSNLHTVTRFADDGVTAVAASTYGYDGMGRLNSLSHTQGAAPSLTTLDAYTFGHDAASNVTSTSSVWTLNGVTKTDATNYGLDSTNQLTSASLTNENYSYDANGNRTNGGNVTGPGNELLSDGTYKYVYDAEANLVKQIAIIGGAEEDFTWDYHDRLVKVTSGSGATAKTINYTYDYLGRRIRKDVTSGGGATSYDYLVYDGSKPILEVADSTSLAGGGPPAVTHRFLNAAAVDQILADDQFSTAAYGTLPGPVWFLPDNQGTARDLVALSSGQWVLATHRGYNSFGAASTPNYLTAVHVDTQSGYTGGITDADTGLIQYVHRWYNPLTGRWLSEDPANSTSNLFAYAGNNPATNIDPTGLCVTYTAATSYDAYTFAPTFNPTVGYSPTSGIASYNPLYANPVVNSDSAPANDQLGIKMEFIFDGPSPGIGSTTYNSEVPGATTYDSGVPGTPTYYRSQTPSGPSDPISWRSDNLARRDQEQAARVAAQMRAEANEAGLNGGARLDAYANNWISNAPNITTPAMERMQNETLLNFTGLSRPEADVGLMRLVISPNDNARYTDYDLLHSTNIAPFHHIVGIGSNPLNYLAAAGFAAQMLPFAAASDASLGMDALDSEFAAARLATMTEGQMPIIMRGGQLTLNPSLSDFTSPLDDVANPLDAYYSRSSGLRPGSVSGNPANRLMETGVPLKNGLGWVKRWTAATAADEQAQARAVSSFYDQVLQQSKNVPDAQKTPYIFEQMRQFRTQYRQQFLKNRGR